MEIAKTVDTSLAIVISAIALIYKISLIVRSRNVYFCTKI